MAELPRAGSFVIFVNTPEHGHGLTVDKFMLTSVGSALAFLAVFRSNSAYERWWDGRKKWGMVINRTRDLARQSIGYMGDDVHAEVMVRYTIAFAVAMKRHLRFERELTELVKNAVLTQEQSPEPVQRQR